jgi:acyl-CoA reductase-like NAD-dependent aldehyde dehydrogenase
VTLSATDVAAGGPRLDQQLASLRALARRSRAGYDVRRQVLGQLADRLLERQGDAAALSTVPGFAFLASFLRPDHIEHLIAAELPLPALRGYAAAGDRRGVRLVPRGVVCHWIAGNVPLLGMFSWAVSMLLGNINVVRLSSRQDDLLTPLLRLLASVSPEGEQLAAETLALQFDRDDEAAHAAMSAAADVRIAWGGREAVEAILRLPCEWDCETLVLGPRMSMAVVDPAAVTPKSLARLATDIAYFDQQACSSPQRVYVKGQPGTAAFDDLVAGLSHELSEQTRKFPRHPLDFGETYRIVLDRARVALSGGHLRQDGGTQWTVALVERAMDEVRCANRFVQVVPFQAVGEIVPEIPRNVQSAVIALDGDDTAAFTEAAAHAGVCRFPRPGQGNFFETPWDGVPVASRLVRWVVRSESA